VCVSCMWNSLSASQASAAEGYLSPTIVVLGAGSMVAPTYNLSYSGGRGRGILSLRPAQTKVARPCLKM
jgi:hypothetical protein